MNCKDISHVYAPRGDTARNDHRSTGLSRGRSGEPKLAPAPVRQYSTKSVSTCEFQWQGRGSGISWSLHPYGNPGPAVFQQRNAPVRQEPEQPVHLPVSRPGWNLDPESRRPELHQPRALQKYVVSLLGNLPAESAGADWGRAAAEVLQA